MPSESVIVTGANAGLGVETVRALARDRQRLLVLACRDQEAGQAAAARLEADGGRAVFLPLDLADQNSIQRFAELFRAAHLPPLAAVICNAGVQNVVAPTVAADGSEMTFAVNHLGHYLLVRLLLADLTAGGTVTFVSSGTHDPRERTGMPHPVYSNAAEVARDLKPGRTAGLRRYTTSKLCNVLLAYELSRRLATSGDKRFASLFVNAIDPGLMPATGLARSWPAPLRWVSRHLLPLARLVSPNVHAPRISGERVAALASGPDARPGGRYFSNGRAMHSSDQSYDRELQRELWESSAVMTGTPIDLV